jgi:hypothetical protein
MEEITAGVLAPEAPPGDGAAEAPPPVAAEAPPSTPIDVTQLPDFNDPDATEAWIAASTEATNTQAESGEPVEAATDSPPTASTDNAALTVNAPRSEPATETPPDYQKVLADLQAQGYKVEPPAPPPDPYSLLTAELAPLVGTREEYAQAKTLALTPIEDTDPDWSEKVTARDAAAAQVRAFDTARQTTDLAKRWSRQAVLGEIGVALDPVPAKYGLSPEQAQRVVQPTALTDAIDAVAEALTAKHAAAMAERETYWQGRVKQASTDRSADAVRRMGAAPQAGSTPGRSAGPAAPWGASSVPDEAWIQKAISGELAGVDLSDR